MNHQERLVTSVLAHQVPQHWVVDFLVSEVTCLHSHKMDYQLLQTHGHTNIHMSFLHTIYCHLAVAATLGLTPNRHILILRFSMDTTVKCLHRVTLTNMVKVAHRRLALETIL